MPTTKNKLVYNLLNIIRGGHQSDDDAISLRQVGFWVDNTRNYLIRQDLNKSRSISDNITQSLGCVAISQVDASTCCGFTVDCKVYRSDRQLPKTIETNQEDLITRIGSIVLGSQPYPIIPMARVPYVGFTPFLGLNNSIKAAIQNRYVYLFVPKHNKVIKNINVIGVFANPEELATWNTCAGTACYTNNSDYPISDHMIETMTQMIINTDLKLIASAPTDNQGDAKSDVQPNQTK